MVSEEIVRQPLSADELERRRQAEQIIRFPEATPSGGIVERSAPTVAPAPVFQARQETYD